jgi:hypothetical protein
MPSDKIACPAAKMGRAAAHFSQQVLRKHYHTDTVKGKTNV